MRGGPAHDGEIGYYPDRHRPGPTWLHSLARQRKQLSSKKCPMVYVAHIQARWVSEASPKSYDTASYASLR